MEKRHGLFGVDLLKHALAICVIFQHLHSDTRYSASTNARISEVVFWVQGAVLVFFLISGYFFHVKSTGRLLADLSVHIRHYGKRLLLPFVLFSAINCIALVRLGKLTFHTAAISFASGYGVGMQIYFLSYLFLITVIAALVGFTAGSSLRREIPTLSVLAVAMVMTALNSPTQSPTGSEYRNLPLYLLAFIVGRFISIAQNQIPHKSWLVISGIVLVLGVLGMKDFRFYYIAAGVGVFALAHWLSFYLPNRRGPGSGGVYLLHTPIVNFAISIALLKVGFAQWPNAILSVVCTYLLCLAFTLGFIRILPKWRWMLLE